jgi:hypothetical protein
LNDPAIDIEFSFQSDPGEWADFLGAVTGVNVRRLWSTSGGYENGRRRARRRYGYRRFPSRRSRRPKAVLQPGSSAYRHLGVPR